MRRMPLFAAGIFFGGAVDHLVLALRGSALTPYGLSAGAFGNWALLALDGVLALLLYLLHRRLERQAKPAGREGGP